MNRDHAHPATYTLLTGATGALGQLLLPNLLRARLPVVVLVRPKGGVSAADRIEAQLQAVESSAKRMLPRPVVLDGDLRRPGLGLSSDQRQWVADHCGRVLHSAANLSFRPASAHPDNEPFQTNVDGTSYLLQLCQQTSIREFHFVSTAYVCGMSSGVVMEEEFHDMTPPEFANDYERSKAQAEQLLRDSNEAGASAPFELPLGNAPDGRSENLTQLMQFSSNEKSKALDSLTIYRPSIVVDPDSECSAETDQAISTAFSMFRMLSTRFGMPQPGEWLKNLGLTGSERKNIVRADWVCRLIVQILRRSELHGRTYHLTSERGTAIQSLEEGFRGAVSSTDSKLNGNAIAAPSPQATPSQETLLNKLAEPYVATFQPYFRDDPRFGRTNLDHALNVCGESPCADVTADDIRKLAISQTIGSEVNNVPAGRSARRSDVASKPRDVGATSATHSIWTSLVSWYATFAPATPEITGDAYGVELSGPGGGAWTIRVRGGQFTMRPGTTTTTQRRIYTSATLLCELLMGDKSVDAAIANGELLVEQDGASEAGKWLENLLQAMSMAASAEPLRNQTQDEVAHAG